VQCGTSLSDHYGDDGHFESCHYCEVSGDCLLRGRKRGERRNINADREGEIKRDRKKEIG
jgi:hypothetical protein